MKQPTTEKQAIVVPHTFLLAQTTEEQCCFVSQHGRCPYKAAGVGSTYTGFYLCWEHIKARVGAPKSTRAEKQKRVKEERQKRIKAIRRENKRVEYHFKRAEKIALAATLTLAQWIETLDHFEWKCAYCERGEYQVLEHYVPLFHGGGTTAYNCFPACSSCNAIKTDAHPSIFEEKFSEESIQHIKAYIARARCQEVYDAS